MPKTTLLPEPDDAPGLFQDGLIDWHIQRVVCARCYGDLAKERVRFGWWRAYCPTCEGAWGGAVISRRAAEERGQQALADYIEITRNMPDLFPREQKSISETLAELGF